MIYTRILMKWVSPNHFLHAQLQCACASASANPAQPWKNEKSGIKIPFPGSDRETFAWNPYLNVVTSAGADSLHVELTWRGVLVLGEPLTVSCAPPAPDDAVGKRTPVAQISSWLL